MSGGGGGTECSSITEWVEIIEPRTQDHMFANLTTGECVWEPPAGVNVKRANDDQWWELFDSKTSRFYYYNASSQKTVWHRPAHCDIIPLAKLQKLKQNTQVVINAEEAGDEADVSDLAEDGEEVVKNHHKTRRKSELVNKSCQSEDTVSLDRLLPIGRVRMTSLTRSQTSPISQRKTRQHYHKVHHFPSPRTFSESLEQLKKKPKSDTAQISRSISFMSRNPDCSYDKFFGPVGWTKTEQRSVESTPKSSRKKKESPQKNGNRSPSISSPIEGYCTPMINRKQVNSPPAVRPTPKPRLSLINSPKSPAKSSPNKADNLSISDLVDTGLNTLIEDDLEKVPLRPKKPSVVKRNGPSLALQSYMCEQAKRYVAADSDISEDEFSVHREDSDFADNEDASSLEEEDYLSGPTYQELGSTRWLQSLERGGKGRLHSVPPPVPPHKPKPLPFPNQLSSPDVDAFSEDFDKKIRLHSQSSSGNTTMPRNGSSGGRPSLPAPQQPSYPSPYEILHPSLQRNAHSLLVEPGFSKPQRYPYSDSTDSLRRPRTSLDHGQSEAAAAAAAAAARHMSTSRLSVSSSIPSKKSDLVQYAKDNMNVQKRGIFRQKMNLVEIMSWSPDSLGKPLTCAAMKTDKKSAVEVFKWIQIYMRDRKAKPGTTITSLALDIIDLGYGKPALRDEIYVQLCKQTNGNPMTESLRRGWELMTMCLSFFPPTPEFAPVLQNYIFEHFKSPVVFTIHVEEHAIAWELYKYAAKCAKRLDRIGESGRLGPRKPTKEEIDQSRWQIIRPSLFGETLTESMTMQSQRFPDKCLPWILTTLGDKVIRLNGDKTEGIFRVPADFDDVNRAKLYLDSWDPDKVTDCHTAACLLKQWFRELYEPLIPDSLYQEAIELGDRLENLTTNYENRQPVDLLNEFINKLSELNYIVLLYLINYLQRFSRPETVAITKMDASNLATIFAPNCLRCTSTDPIVMIQNTSKEMAFLKNLIKYLDTSNIEGVV